MRTATLALAAAAAVLVSGCGATFPGVAAAEDFADHFTAAHPEHVVEAVTQSDAKLPWVGGRMSGLLVLADDTPPEALDQILTEVAEWEPEHSSSYEPVGVVANGVGVCLGDDQVDLKRELREALYAEQEALAGEWLCPQWGVPEGIPPEYAAPLADFTRDTALVTELLGDSDLVVHAKLSDPWGSVAGPWTEVPPQLEQTLAAVAAAHQVMSYGYDDEQGLRVAVPPTADLSDVQTLAEEVAGPDLPVEIVQGSLDPERAAELEQLAPVADDLRSVPGVASVGVLPHSITVSIEDPGAAQAVRDTALEHPEFAEVSLRIEFPVVADDGRTTYHRYTLQPGAAGDEVALFRQLIDADLLEAASLAEPADGTATGLNLTLDAPLADGFPRLKALLPEGLRVVAQGTDGHATVEFTTARTLQADDLETRWTTPDLEQLARDWNAAP